MCTVVVRKSQNVVFSQNFILTRRKKIFIMYVCAAEQCHLLAKTVSTRFRLSNIAPFGLCENLIIDSRRMPSAAAEVVTKNHQ